MKEFVGKIVKVIGEFFKGPNGEGSSKRLIAIALFAAVITYILMPVAYTGPKDPVAMGILTTAGTALLGVAAATKS